MENIETSDGLEGGNTDDLHDLMNVIAVEGFVSSEITLTADEKKQISVAKFYLFNPTRSGTYKYGNHFRVVVYGKKAERCAEKLSKGTLCSVMGKVSTWQQPDKEGKMESGITILANEVYLGVRHKRMTGLVDSSDRREPNDKEE